LFDEKDYDGFRMGEADKQQELESDANSDGVEEI
jgi:hypothetical protein